MVAMCFWSRHSPETRGRRHPFAYLRRTWQSHFCKVSGSLHRKQCLSLLIATPFVASNPAPRCHHFQSIEDSGFGGSRLVNSTSEQGQMHSWRTFEQDGAILDWLWQIVINSAISPPSSLLVAVIYPLDNQPYLFQPSKTSETVQRLM